MEFASRISQARFPSGISFHGFPLRYNSAALQFANKHRLGQMPRLPWLVSVDNFLIPVYSAFSSVNNSFTLVVFHARQSRKLRLAFALA